MKKFLIIVFAIAILIAGYSYDQFGWAKKLLFGEPTTHVIQRGEFLSKIAKKYYGRADYWRELALINRAPDSDMVFPGEEIIIPSLDVIKEIRRTQWLSKVNNYVKNQEDIIARLNMGEEPVLTDNSVDGTEPMTTPEQMAANEANSLTPGSEQVYASVDQDEQSMYSENEQSQSASSLGLILAVIGAIFVASLIAIVLIRRRKRSQITIIDDDDLNILDEEEESEPDYNEYLKNKSHEKEGVLVN